MTAFGFFFQITQSIKDFHSGSGSQGMAKNLWDGLIYIKQIFLKERN